MAKVRWSDEAIDDLHAIGVYYDRTSPQYAKSIVGRLYAAPEVLADHPHLGRELPEKDIEHARELVRDGYRIVYLASENEVIVIAVLHGRQDLRQRLRRE